MGYTNASVFGGMAAFVERECRLNLARQTVGPVRLLWGRLLELSREYLRRPPSGRAKLLLEMEATLEELAALQPAPDPPPPAAALRAAAAPPTAAGRSCRPRRSPAASGRSQTRRDVPSPASPDSPVGHLRGVGPQRARLLERLGIFTIQDLLLYLPREYEDRSSFPPLAEVVPRPGVQTVRGRITEIRQSSPRRGMKVIRALLGDSSGTITAVWFNQPYVLQQLKRDDQVVVTGRVVDNFPYGI
ncbi:MAG: OB-fold nucleic acid binding domain-containing protein, partial [Syntrophomonadaceae bacterium]|nr:OB-fold nucleic acid binding domain-containing protein [Syntrophomonadaceae bacterium]